jgi:hypothetical protein
VSEGVSVVCVGVARAACLRARLYLCKCLLVCVRETGCCARMREILMNEGVCWSVRVEEGSVVWLGGNGSACFFGRYLTW